MKKKMTECLIKYKSAASANVFCGNDYDRISSDLRVQTYVNGGLRGMSNILDRYGIVFCEDKTMSYADGECIAFMNAAGFPVIIVSKALMRIDLVFLYLFRALRFIYGEMFISCKKRIFIDKIRALDVTGKQYVVNLYGAGALLALNLNINSGYSETDLMQVSIVRNIPMVFIVGALYACKDKKWVLRRKNKWVRQWIQVKRDRVK